MYYFAASTEQWFPPRMRTRNPTVISAAACMSSAGSYVVAVENGKLRELNDAEEREFQHAVHGGVVERALKGITVTVSIKWYLS